MKALIEQAAESIPAAVRSIDRFFKQRARFSRVEPKSAATILLLRLGSEVQEMLRAPLIRSALTVGFRPVPQTTPRMARAVAAARRGQRDPPLDRALLQHQPEHGFETQP